jgi:hypothetical protein
VELPEALVLSTTMKRFLEVDPRRFPKFLSAFAHSDFVLTQPRVEDRSVSSFNFAKCNPHSLGG